MAVAEEVSGSSEGGAAGSLSVSGAAFAGVGYGEDEAL